MAPRDQATRISLVLRITMIVLFLQDKNKVYKTRYILG